MNYKEQFDFWLADDYFDAKTKEELLAIRNDEKEVEDRFYKDLEFGTGGLRGVIGAGTNRMNIYTVRKASQGLANYINEQGGADRGVVISFDSRVHSVEFAEETAKDGDMNFERIHCFAAGRGSLDKEIGGAHNGNDYEKHQPPEIAKEIGYFDQCLGKTG